jgi:uncharacterized protein YndB with AHSA1/START domain
MDVLFLTGTFCTVVGMSERNPPRATPTGKGTRKKFGVIKQTIIVNASPLEVYQAYVDPKKHAAFTGTKATGTQKVGGKFTAGDGYISGKYIKLESGKRIKHEWTTTEWPTGFPPSIVEITLKPKGAKTELTMVHTRVPAEQTEYYAEGWKEYYWGPLKKRFSETLRPT